MRTITKRFVWPDGEEVKVTGTFCANMSIVPLVIEGNTERLREFLGEVPDTAYGQDYEAWWSQHDGRDGVRVFTSASGSLKMFIE